MSTVIEFAVFGLGTGAIYALLAEGLVLVYRGSGILNFAQGALAMVAAFVFVQLHDTDGWSFTLSFLTAVALVTALGAIIHLVIMRPMRNSSALARLISTLGILILLQGLIIVKYGDNLTVVPSSLPNSPITLFGATIPQDRLWLLGLAIVVTGVLYMLSKYTTFGLATSAVAEDQRAASALGWSPDLVAVVTWSAGSALAAVAGILIVPIAGLQATNLTLVIIAAMAAALVGGFRSYPLALAAAMVIGIIQSEMANYVTLEGAATAFPFVAILVILVVQGKALPLRGFRIEHLPRLGSGRPRPVWIVAIAGLLSVGLFTIFSTNLIRAVTAQTIAGVILLSIVVLTGYAGQLSLAQYALAGMGAYFAGRLVSVDHWAFAPALVVGVLGAAAFGVVFGLPALRTRGVNLAVLTLGLGLAIQQVLFNSANFTGGVQGTTVGSAHFLGINLDPIGQPARYALFCLVWFVIVALMVSNVRRSRAGRRLVAIRGNERAAASLGINVFESKLYAFGLASGIAGLGGILLAFQSTNIVYGNFDPISSILFVADTVIGGVGYVTGAIAGSFYVSGGTGSVLLNHVTSLAAWLSVIAGASVILVLVLNPDGMVPQFLLQDHKIMRRISPRALQDRATRRKAKQEAALCAMVPAPSSRTEHGRRVKPAILRVRDLTVRFGGVVALESFDIDVRPGQVVGLIGPNGAGKTTLIDAVTGFVRPAQGKIMLDGTSIDVLRAHRRAREGISRSFQGLELFEDLSVLENLQLACDRRDRVAYLSSLVWPSNPRLPESVGIAVREFGLQDTLNQFPGQLPFGVRRLVAIARAIASEPSVLLLDEPAAGLDERQSAELSRVVRRLADEWGIAILLIEHDMNVVMGICDEVVVLDFGRKISQGSPQEVRRDPAVAAAYLGQLEDPAAEDDQLPIVSVRADRPEQPEEASVPLVPHREAIPNAYVEEGSSPIIEAQNLTVGYGSVVVVRELDFKVRPGEVVALLGANGAGKTTTLLAVAGELRPVSGAIRWKGQIVKTPLHRRVRAGMRFVTEERSVFMSMTVAENLRVGRRPVAEALEHFPELRPLMNRKAGLLSGGEQQILTLARALSGQPELLLADELSLGLAPLVVDRLLTAVRSAADDGMAVILVEQQVRQALEIADRAYVLRRGRVVLEGSSAELLAQREAVEASYLAALSPDLAVDDEHWSARP
jgi:ABC-type branched-subunit amino acid transport system ATPase component/ABC-type branched-subunit amino acid transport system permease subunit